MEILKEVFELSSDYALQQIEIKGNKKFYLFNIKTGEIYKLNETSFKFLSLIDGRLKIENVLYSIAEEYGVSFDVIKKDFNSLITEWVKSGVIIKTKGGE